MDVKDLKKDNYYINNGSSTYICEIYIYIGVNDDAVLDYKYKFKSIAYKNTHIGSGEWVFKSYFSSTFEVCLNEKAIKKLKPISKYDVKVLKI